eukprot:545166-Amphidinium_carterae.1
MQWAAQLATRTGMTNDDASEALQIIDLNPEAKVFGSSETCEVYKVVGKTCQRDRWHNFAIARVRLCFLRWMLCFQALPTIPVQKEQYEERSFHFGFSARSNASKLECDTGHAFQTVLDADMSAQTVLLNGTCNRTNSSAKVERNGQQRECTDHFSEVEDEGGCQPSRPWGALQKSWVRKANQAGTLDTRTLLRHEDVELCGVLENPLQNRSVQSKRHAPRADDRDCAAHGGKLPSQFLVRDTSPCRSNLEAAVLRKTSSWMSTQAWKFAVLHKDACDAMSTFAATLKKYGVI